MQSEELQAFSDLVARRRSVRGFLTRAVDQQTLDQVFTAANGAPSNCNTQPWQVAVVSGASCDRLRRRISDAMANGIMQMDFPYDGRYNGVYRERQVDSADQLYNALGIPRKDKARRGVAFMRNFQFFDAPHAAFVFLPEPFGVREAADVGMYAQTLMLAMTAAGIACCPQTSLSFHADIVREELALPEHYKLLFGISFGYEDTEHPANKARLARAALSEATQFFD
ncbi:MAG: nitroreductase [Pseudomonadales bacterium]